MESFTYLIIDKDNYKTNKEMYDLLITSFYKVNGDNYCSLNIADMVLNKDVYYCLIICNKMPICLCRFAKMFDRKTIYCIRQINTLNEFKQKGCASICYTEILKYLKDKNARKVFAFVSSDNLASQNLHKKCGFIQTSPNKTLKSTNYYFEDSICYLKRL